MPSNDEIIERTVHDFQKVQNHMKNAKKENAVETYEGLKKDYKSLKAVLNSLGVNLTDIDKSKNRAPFRSSFSVVQNVYFVYTVIKFICIYSVGLRIYCADRAKT